MRVDTDINQVRQALLRNRHLIEDAGFSPTNITAEELIEYFSGTTPHGDITTLKEVIKNRWLLIHEIAELNLLKSRGFTISRRLVWTNIQEVLESHVTATEVEIQMAFKHRDLDWIHQRMKIISSWPDNTELSSDLKSRLLRIIDRSKDFDDSFEI